MSNRRYTFIISFLLFASVLFSQNESGLYFQSYLVNKDLRSSLHISSEKEFEFSDSFSLEFDMKLQGKIIKFGYIIRAIFSDSLNFDLLLNIPSNSTAHLLFLADKEKLSSVPLYNSNYRINDWNKVKLSFDNRKQICSFELNGKVYNSKYKFPKKKNVDICFGVNKKIPFMSVDVPPIIIKNVYLNIDNKKNEYIWKLNKHAQNAVYDEFHFRKAEVTNPVWLIDSHIAWKRNNELKFPTRIFSVFDGKNTLFIVSTKKIYAYNLINYELSEFAFSPEIPIIHLSNQFIYDAANKQIVYSDFDSIRPKVSRFSFNTKTWDVPIEHFLGPAYQQHNSFYSPIDSSLFQVFGYGFFTYKSDMKQLSKNGNYKTIKLSPEISPRYLSATGILDSNLYVYGGIGNQTGNQEYGSQIYNDLYEVNLRTMKINKCWERDANENNEVAARSLYIDKTRNMAYALFFNPTRYASYLLLNEIDLKRPNIRPLADTIPYFFQDTQSEAMLVFSETTQKLFAITIHKSESTEYFLNTYEISFPILSANEVLQSQNKKLLWWFFISGLFLLVGIYTFFVIRKKRKQLKNSSIYIDQHDDKIVNEQFNLPEKDLKRPGIFLLGGFQIINKDNQDITGEFTPVMKYILTLIILFTLKNGKGISNVKLKELLWYDKSDESARNNRSVNISKIRLILSSISKFEISNENSYWTIDFKDDAFCDYNHSLVLIKSIQKNADISSEQVTSLLQIISAGELLPNIQEDWMDNFKSEYSNLVIDVFLLIKDYKNLADNPKLLIQIADTILLLDTLNEEALHLKCKSLIKLGRIKIAMDVFNSFCKEYKLVLNENFECSFDSFIKQN